MIEYLLATLLLLGLLSLAIPNRFRAHIKAVALSGALVCLVAGVVTLLWPLFGSLTGLFRTNPFSVLFGLGITFTTFTVILFSLGYANFVGGLNRYYCFILWSAAFALGTVYSANLIALVVFWGLTGLALYLLANLLPQGANAAKKSFVFVGGSNSLLILGVALLWLLNATFDVEKVKLPLHGSSPLHVAAFLLLCAAALIRAGAVPFHTWIPDFADAAPLSVSAYLPAAIDKLLGIYLLALTATGLFMLSPSLSAVLMGAGALTVIAAVFLAMIQHDLRRLLAYDSVSQVGYMVLGIASGTAIGIAGGIFHLVNNVIYMSGLFMTAGSIEHRAGHTNLDLLGGLSRYMPVTFVSALVFSLSISGVPPLNGFVSKWMIYQGLVQQFSGPGTGFLVRLLSVVSLAIIMFGSALTLASFIKLMHAAFLSRAPLPDGEMRAIYRETGATMWLPQVLLALLCVVLGIFAAPLSLNRLVFPALAGIGVSAPVAAGIWQSTTALILVLFALAAGAAVYLAVVLKARRVAPFIGGETLPAEERVTGTDFYRTISDIGFFRTAYALAGKKTFDLYDLAARSVLGLGHVLSVMHTGSLRTYLFWFLLGFLIILAIL